MGKAGALPIYFFFWIFMTQLAQEGIHHQLNSKLGKELEEALASLRTRGAITQRDINELGLDKIVSKHTGLHTTFEIMNEENMAVMPPVIDKNSIMISDDVRSYIEDFKLPAELRSKKILTGTVNIKNATISGDLSKMLSTVYVGKLFLDRASRYTVAETTAVILHEIGHIFAYFEMMCRVSRTNYFLTEITERLLKTQKAEYRLEILTTVEKALNVKIPAKESITKKPRNKATLIVILMNAELQSSKQDLDSNIYSEKGFEQLADNFVARMGYAMPLATGLNKLLKYDFRSRINPWVNTLLNIIMTLDQALAVYVSPLNIIYVLLGLLFMPSTFVSNYDSSRQRIVKIKNQLNDALKDPNLSLAQKQVYIKNHAAITKILDKLYDNLTMYGAIWAYLIPAGIKQKNIIQHQDELESLANNDLFTAQAMLSTL